MKNYDKIYEDYCKDDGRFIKESIWRKSSKAFSIEAHSELIKACYELKMLKEFTQLMEIMQVRIKYRRVEVPYVSNIDIIATSIPNPNIPNRYEKLSEDLNINLYSEKVQVLKEQGLLYKPKAASTVTTGKGKSGEKSKQGEKKEEIGENKAVNPDQIDHCYIYCILRRSHNPSKALIGLKVLHLDDNKIKSMVLKETERAIAIPIKTYNSKLSPELNTPFILIEKTGCDLRSEQEKLLALTDLSIFITKAPYLDPPDGVRKLETELTDIPNNGVNYNYNHSHIYFAYKYNSNKGLMRTFTLLNVKWILFSRSLS